MVADTLSQWYFQPAGNANPALIPSARRGLRNGLTSSFGSICFASLILAIIKILREAMNKAQDNANVRTSSSLCETHTKLLRDHTFVFPLC